MIKHAFVMGALAVAVLLAIPGVVLAHTIPADKVDEQKVFWGSPASFEKPGEVNYTKIVKSTPEYGAIKKKKIKPGSAKYWIQMSAASNHAVRIISEVGEDTGYDLIVAKGYLGSVEVNVAADDLTAMVLEKLDE